VSRPDAWMPLYIGDYLSDTGHLTPEQHGAYLLLLMAAWTRGGVLPDDDRILARLASCSTWDWKRLRPSIQTFFETDGKLWRNSRLSRQLLDAQTRRKRAEDRAKVAAEKRWENNETPNASSMGKSEHAPSIDSDMLGASAPAPAPQKATTTTKSTSLSRNGNGLHPPERGTRLPENWQLPIPWRDWACTVAKIDMQHATRCSLRFRDFWIGVPGARGRKANWEATWRNFIRKEFDL